MRACDCPIALADAYNRLLRLAVTGSQARELGIIIDVVKQVGEALDRECADVGDVGEIALRDTEFRDQRLPGANHDSDNATARRDREDAR